MSGKKAIEDLRKHNAIIGLNIKPKEELVCEACAHGKVCRVSHHASTKSKSIPGILHLDTVGPIKPTSVGGNRYFVLTTEERSGYKLITFTQTKADIDLQVISVIREVQENLHSESNRDRPRHRICKREFKQLVEIV